MHKRSNHVFPDGQNTYIICSNRIVIGASYKLNTLCTIEWLLKHCARYRRIKNRKYFHIDEVFTQKSNVYILQWTQPCFFFNFWFQVNAICIVLWTPCNVHNSFNTKVKWTQKSTERIRAKCTVTSDTILKPYHQISSTSAKHTSNIITQSLSLIGSSKPKPSCHWAVCAQKGQAKLKNLSRTKKVVLQREEWKDVYSQIHTIHT